MIPITTPFGEGQRRVRKWPAAKLHDAAMESDIVDAMIEARLAKETPRVDVARALNLSPATLYYWEHGISFPDRLSKLVAWGRVVGVKVTVRVD